MKIFLSLFATALLLGIPASAQTKDMPTDYDRALAAGYKAQFICSGLWNGEKSMTDIESDELTGVYPRIAKTLPSLTVQVDEIERQILVKYSDEAPPRTALWNRKTGCTSMPIGFSRIKLGAEIKHREHFDDLAWPMGDQVREIRANKKTMAVRRTTAKAFDAATYGAGSKTSAVVIIKNGNIIAEEYKSDHDLHTAQRTWSVAKSIAGTLIGHSVHKGFVKTSDPAPIPEWQKFGDTRSIITLDNLMRMTSGLTSDTAGNRTDPIYMGAAVVTQRTTSWPILYRPGSRFRYSNNDILLAVHAVRSAHLDKKNDFGNYIPKEHDFDPYQFFQTIGMTRTYAETDWQDNYILSSQVWTTARDLGRLGLLYLNNGLWPYGKDKDERLLPEDWRGYVTTPSGPQPKREAGYGATFWLMNNSQGIPKDAFAGFGNRGQYLVIIPSMDLVIVRRGYDTRDTRFDIAAFVKDVVKAIK